VPSRPWPEQGRRAQSQSSARPSTSKNTCIPPGWRGSTASVKRRCSSAPQRSTSPPPRTKSFSTS
jgi:hypothetical protein